MKASTARLHYTVMFILALVGVSVFSAIVGLSAVFPFAFSRIRDVLGEKLGSNGQKSITAVEAAKAKKEALKKEKAKLAKEKKKLDKKQKKILDKRVKKIYEERVSEGYEASLKIMGASVTSAPVAPIMEPAPAKKSKKAPKVVASVVPATPVAPVAPVATAPAAPILPVAPESEAPSFDFGLASGDDYRTNGSMFRGISF